MEGKVKHTGNVLTGTFNLKFDYYLNAPQMSVDYLVGGLTHFQMKATALNTNKNSDSYNFGNSNRNNYRYKLLILFAFDKLNEFQDDCRQYMIYLTSTKLNIANRGCNSDLKFWHVLCDDELTGANTFSFDITAVVQLVPQPPSFQMISDDEELLDFEIRGKDGSVRMHKIVMAASSPVFKTMLTGDWLEKKIEFVEFKDTSKETLQQLKEYLYAGNIPETGLEELLALAAMYGIEDLVNRCSVKLLFAVTEANVTDLMVLACKYKTMVLYFGIVKNYQQGYLKPTVVNNCLGKEWM